MYRAFKSSDYCRSLMETAASSTHWGQCKENHDAKAPPEHLSKGIGKIVKVRTCFELRLKEDTRINTLALTEGKTM